MTNPNDPSKILPRAIPPGYGNVRPFEFAVRTLIDYDMNFMQDRIVSEIFINGQPAKVYSVARINESVGSPEEAQHVMALYGPELERAVIDQFMGLGYRQQVRDLEREVRDLKAYINRPRWFHFRPVRREVRIFRARLGEMFAAVAKGISPKGDE